MAEFSIHKVLFPLQPDLNIIVADWVAQLADCYIYDDAYQLYEDLRQIIFHDDTLTLSPDNLTRLRDWMSSVPVKQLVGALTERGGWGSSSRVPPKATPDQLRIIDEAQREIGLDFSRLADQFTTWEADVCIKGILAVSEVQRLTGDRHFKPKDLRRAIREYILSDSSDHELRRV